jgi:hypothetical protein
MKYLLLDTELLAHSQQVRYLKAQGLSEDQAVEVMLEITGAGQSLVRVEEALYREFYRQTSDKVLSDFGKFWEGLHHSLGFSLNRTQLLSLIALYGMPTEKFLKLAELMFAASGTSYNLRRERVLGTIAKEIWEHKGGATVDWPASMVIIHEDREGNPVILENENSPEKKFLTFLHMVYYLAEQDMDPNIMLQVVDRLPPGLPDRKALVFERLFDAISKTEGFKAYNQMRFDAAEAVEADDSRRTIFYDWFDLDRFGLDQIADEDK